MTKRKPPEEHLDPGRPTKYKKEYNELVFKLTLLGSTDIQMADIIGIAERTLNDWKIAHPTFLQSIIDGKEKADAEVADSLRNRALGYTHEEEKIFCNDGEVTRVKTTKHYPPDTQAASLWLRNRQPDRWRDKQEIEVTRRPLEDLSDEELKRELELIRQERKALTSED